MGGYEYFRCPLCGAETDGGGMTSGACRGTGGRYDGTWNCFSCLKVVLADRDAYVAFHGEDFPIPPTYEVRREVPAHTMVYNVVALGIKGINDVPLEIFFSDLNEYGQGKVLSFYQINSPEDANLDVFPLFHLDKVEPVEIEESKED